MLQTKLVLTVEGAVLLKEVALTHCKAYMRERAGALLKIASGCSQKWVAEWGLLVKRREHTVGAWVNRYMSAGISGLYDAPRSGRKSAFSPLNPSGGTRSALNSCSA